MLNMLKKKEIDNIISISNKLKHSGDIEDAFEIIKLAQRTTPSDERLELIFNRYKRKLGYYSLEHNKKLAIEHFLYNCLFKLCEEKGIIFFGVGYKNSIHKYSKEKPSTKHTYVYTEGEIFRLDVPYKNIFNNNSSLERENDKEKLFIVGSSSAFQPFIKFEDTIEYKLFHQYDYQHCESIGYSAALGGAFSIMKTIKMINEGFISHGDIIVSLSNYNEKFISDANYDIYNVSFSDYDHYYDKSHFSEKGVDLICMKIQEVVEEKKQTKNLYNQNNKESMTSKESFYNLKYSIEGDRYKNNTRMISKYINLKSTLIDEGFESFKRYLIRYKDSNAENCASILVNCNPITLGHQHLIETACESVDRLYLFVIETELNDYSFEDRYNMVKLNYQANDKITVLRGGNFMCTEHIIPEYFNKDSFEDGETSHIEGLKLESFYFGNKIAPLLNIKNIWLGSEPTCELTNKYNQFMSESMPSYGIKVNIIPRIKNQGIPISASHVRKCMKLGNFVSVKSITSEITYDYLKHIHHPVDLHALHEQTFSNLLLELEIDSGETYEEISKLDEFLGATTLYLTKKYLKYFEEVNFRLNESGVNTVHDFASYCKSLDV
jgi:hypothetical protein